MEIKVSKAKFTKGEWVVKGSSMAMGSIYRGNFSVKSNCFSGNISDANNANASLIAAAPEMYDLLESISKHVDGGRIKTIMGVDDEIKLSDKLLNIYALLAKARGE